MSYKVLLLSTGLFLSLCDYDEKKQEVPTDLQAGCERLLQGNSSFRQSVPATKIESLAHGQHPFAVVVSCSDSRVPPELIFDQGLGDLFVVRTAGNTIGELEMGSIEYAVANLHTPMIIVLGHDECGAMHAYHEHRNDSLPGNMQSLMNYFKQEDELKSIDQKNSSCMSLLVKGNVLHGVHVLENDPLLVDYIRKGQLTITGAIYHLDDGSVELLDE